MANDRTAKTPGKAANDKTADPVAQPASVAIASKGIRTSNDAANFLSALVTDIMTESVSVRLANASCNAMGKLFKVVEMQHRYAKPEGSADSPLVLSNRCLSPEEEKEMRRVALKEELAALETA